MRSEVVYPLIYLGTAMRFVQDSGVGYSVGGDGMLLDNVRSIITNCENFGFHVTPRVAARLRDYLQDKFNLDPKYQTVQTDVDFIKEEAKCIRAALDAESLGVEAYFASDKRYTLAQLVHGMDELYGVGRWDELPEVVRYDFSEAGKCIAFERFTSAAFHILRGTEGVLKEYYCDRVRQKRVSPMMWGNMVTDLEKKKKPPSKELTDHLRNLKDNYRNPTAHPDKIYNLNEVQNLLSLSIDVVQRMCGDFR